MYIQHGPLIISDQGKSASCLSWKKEGEEAQMIVNLHTQCEIRKNRHRYCHWPLHTVKIDLAKQGENFLYNKSCVLSLQILYLCCFFALYHLVCKYVRIQVPGMCYNAFILGQQEKLNVFFFYTKSNCSNMVCGIICIKQNKLKQEFNSLPQFGTYMHRIVDCT